MDPRRMREAACAGRRCAEEKQQRWGTSAQSWPDDWQAAWAGALSLEPHLPKIAPEELSTLIDHATDAARRRWTEILEAERALEDNQALDTETRALALCEALRDHVPAGLSVGREGSRVYLQDTSDAHETTVTSIADAARAVTDWQERHFGR